MLSFTGPESGCSLSVIRGSTITGVSCIDQRTVGLLSSRLEGHSGNILRNFLVQVFCSGVLFTYLRQVISRTIVLVILLLLIDCNLW